MSPFPWATFEKPSLATCLVVCGAVLLLSACDDATVAPDVSQNESETTPEEPLPPNVRLQIQYDQTEVTYSNVWPESIVGNDSEKKERGAKRMTEYEKTREVRSYDDEGYLSASYEYIEGHSDMNMPENAYSDLQSEMPYNPEDENPVVRVELGENTMRYLREDGSEARSRPIDPEHYRIAPAVLDSLIDSRDDTSGADNRRSNVLASLERRGISFRRLDENRVAYEKKVEEVRGTSKVTKVVDLRIGQPIYLKYELKNGKTDMVETRKYRTVSDFPVLVQSVTYDYDDRKGSWGVVARTEVTRRNVSVRTR